MWRGVYLHGNYELSKFYIKSDSKVYLIDIINGTMNHFLNEEGCLWT